MRTGWCAKRCHASVVEGAQREASYSVTNRLRALSEDDDTLDRVEAFFGGDATDYDDGGGFISRSAPIKRMVTAFGAELTNGLVDESPPPPRRAPSVVVQPVPPSSTEMRHRVVQPPDVVEAPLRLPPQPSWWARKLRLWNDNYEWAKIKYKRRLAPILAALYKARARLACAFIVLAALLACIIVVTAVTPQISNPHAFVAATEYARHGHDGVDLTRPATAVSCNELTTEAVLLQRAHARATRLMTADALNCICGPMIREPRRYLAIRLDATTILHTYNPVIDATWTGALDDGTHLNITWWLITENQRALFPTRTDDVTVVRRSAVRLVYMDGSCATAAVVVQASVAYCVQACCDLLDGRSVYDASTTPPL